MEYNKSVINRLKRIEGQIRGVLNMIEKNRNCGEVITQLSASRTGIDCTLCNQSFYTQKGHYECNSSRSKG